MSQLGPECNGKIQFWSTPSQVITSLLTPGVTAARALHNFKKLACWTARQLNITLNIITGMLVDADCIRHALLQNRAAIDFLLLVQGHGCEDFEGMCCMNLSDHSVSIHRRLKETQENMKKIMTGHGLDRWLEGFGLLGG